MLQVVDGRVSLGAGQLEQLIDEHGEPADIALDAAEGGSAVVAREGQIDGDVEPGQGRAELVRDVLQQPPLGRQESLDPPGHLVEGPRQLADLVLPRRMDPRRQVALAEPVDHLAQAPQRARPGARPGSSPSGR